VEHDQAMTLMAAEKYMLGELDGEERERFEEHFFSCEECAHDILDLSSVTQGSRELLKSQSKAEPAQRRSSRGWFEAWRLPASLIPGRLAWSGALAAALIFGSYQTIRLQNTVRPQAIASVFIHPESRGELITVPVERLGAFLLLEADLPEASGKLQWDLQKADSKQLIVQDAAAAPPPGESFKVLLPSSFLAPAEYHLTVRTLSSGKTWLFRFRVGQNLR